MKSKLRILQDIQQDIYNARESIHWITLQPEYFPRQIEVKKIYELLNNELSQCDWIIKELENLENKEER